MVTAGAKVIVQAFRLTADIPSPWAGRSLARHATGCESRRAGRSAAWLAGSSLGWTPRRSGPSGLAYVSSVTARNVRHFITIRADLAEGHDRSTQNGGYLEGVAPLQGLRPVASMSCKSMHAFTWSSTGTSVEARAASLQCEPCPTPHTLPDGGAVLHESCEWVRERHALASSRRRWR